MVETLSVTEGAARLGVCYATLDRAIRRGDVEVVEPSFGEKKERRVPLAEIERLERERRERKPARRTKGSAVPQVAQAPDKKSAAAGGD